MASFQPRNKQTKIVINYSKKRGIHFLMNKIWLPFWSGIESGYYLGSVYDFFLKGCDLMYQ
jgi:hypothetical protein